MRPFLDAGLQSLQQGAASGQVEMEAQQAAAAADMIRHMMNSVETSSSGNTSLIGRSS